MAEPLPALIGVQFPSTPLLTPILSYLRQHTSPSTYNHSIRCAYWALALANRFPQLTSSSAGNNRKINLEVVAVASLLHDLGWATTKELLTDDNRFEVDSANLALKFIEDNRHLLAEHPGHGHSWDTTSLETLWTTIAVHTTPSIAHHHPSPEVVLTQFGIRTDFFGPNFPSDFPPDLMTESEYSQVLSHFPREGFKDEMIQIFCGFCRNKPQVTFDNWQCEFGMTWGLDGKGGGKEEFTKKVEEARIAPLLIGMLERRGKVEPEDKLSMPREKREKYWYEVE